MATAETAFGGGLNSSSGGELKLYLKWKRNTFLALFWLVVGTLAIGWKAGVSSSQISILNNLIPKCTHTGQI